MWLWYYVHGSAARKQRINITQSVWACVGMRAQACLEEEPPAGPPPLANGLVASSAFVASRQPRQSPSSAHTRQICFGHSRQFSTTLGAPHVSARLYGHLRAGNRHMPVGRLAYGADWYTRTRARVRARARARTHTHTLRDMGRPTRISKIYANWHMQADWYVSGQPAGIYAPDWQHIHTVCADQPPAKGPYRHWQQKQPVQTSHTHARCGAGPDPWHRLQPARMRSAVSAGGAMRCGCHATIVA